ncbi:hypothetical protein PSECIP111951_00178 [Pseudoalteromonas holothuriae]|uniref:Uncharacterized protein n=1 Tax=Pseudoalteromonas holothuriae TaxID=2963714 RepID=A0ABM9GDY0_9GAMM|nr:hypothetical protein PSECIP111951_00178 [Pseudoalteromonas sp. CIP111951]
MTGKFILLTIKPQVGYNASTDIKQFICCLIGWLELKVVKIKLPLLCFYKHKGAYIRGREVIVLQEFVLQCFWLNTLP